MYVCVRIYSFIRSCIYLSFLFSYIQTYLIIHIFSYLLIQFHPFIYLFTLVHINTYHVSHFTSPSQMPFLVTTVPIAVVLVALFLLVAGCFCLLALLLAEVKATLQGLEGLGLMKISPENT